jgi:hypothetical protein
MCTKQLITYSHTKNMKVIRLNVLTNNTQPII